MTVASLRIWLAAALVVAAPAQAQMSAFGLAAKVNGVGISNERLERSFNEYLKEQGQNIAAIRYPDRVRRLRREALDLLIEQEVVWQAAQRDGVVATDKEVDEALAKIRGGFKSAQDFQLKLRMEGYTEDSYREHMRRLVSAKKYLDEVAAAAPVSDEAVHEFYVANPDKFLLPEQFRARHILVRVAPGADADTRAQARAEIDGLLEQLRAGADFAELARKHSDDVSAAAGGDLGFFPRGRMVAPFEDAVMSLAPGELSGVVETRYGFHVIRLEDHVEAHQVSEDEARNQVRAYLRSVNGGKRVAERLANLKAAAEIEILAPL